MIDLSNVHRTYHKGGQEVRALDDVTLGIERGEFVAVMGPSGSGKSTLLNVVGPLDRADSGDVRIDGIDVRDRSAADLARMRNERIGFVFQSFHLLPRATAVENVELPLIYAERTPEAGAGMRSLERVGLGDRARHLPGELSGGQQQRVAIARALVCEPDLVLADEPTGNLDSRSSGEILDILCELNRAGTTVVLVTHDAAIARRAARVITIVDGRIESDAASPGHAAASGSKT
jgi:ABC-type lipoprotein export system ATPase subunit